MIQAEIASQYTRAVDIRADYFLIPNDPRIDGGADPVGLSCLFNIESTKWLGLAPFGSPAELQGFLGGSTNSVLSEELIRELFADNDTIGLVYDGRARIPGEYTAPHADILIVGHKKRPAAGQVLRGATSTIWVPPQIKGRELTYPALHAAYVRDDRVIALTYDLTTFSREVAAVGVSIAKDEQIIADGFDSRVSLLDPTIAYQGGVYRPVTTIKMVKNTGHREIWYRDGYVPHDYTIGISSNRTSTNLSFPPALTRQSEYLKNFFQQSLQAA